MKLFDAMTDKYYWLWREEKKKTQEEQGDLTKRVTELNNSLSIALEINDNYQRENVALKEENEKLKAALASAKEAHQYDNRVHQKELKDLGKK